MLKGIIYYGSYFFIVFVLCCLLSDKRRSLADVLLLVGVSLIPLGKLFYTPVTSLISVTAAFIFTAIVGSGFLLLSFIRGINRFILVPFVGVLPAILSLLFLYPNAQSTFVNATSDGSPLLRIVSVFLNSIYCAYIILILSRNKENTREIARYYIWGTLFATAIGSLITYGIFVGQLTRADLMPVSVEDVHVAGRIFRFNPGASVNEFGEIIGYSLLMLHWTRWRTRWKVMVGAILLAAEFLSLTRGALLGLAAGYLFYGIFAHKRQRLKILVAGTLLVSLLLIVIASNDILLHLLITRTSFVNTPGGDERLGTAVALFDALTASPLRMLFGYGWSADIFSPQYGFPDIGYIHSVPLMMLFDTGLVGVAICATAFLVLARFVYANARADLSILAGLIAFMLTVSFFEHTFFHVQTWLIVGVVLGIAFRHSNEATVELERSSLPKMLVTDAQ